MAFDFTLRHAFQPKARSRSSASLTAGPAASCQFAGSSPVSSAWSADCSSMPPLTGRHCTEAERGGGGQVSSRWFFFAVRMSSAAGSKPGAMMTSVKTSATCRAISAVMTPFAAMTPPKADAGSQLWALR